MKAGRELDALVAEKVMGTPRLEGTFVKNIDSENGVVTVGTEWHYPPYSTDIAAAWEVVGKVSRDPSDGCGIGFELHHLNEIAEDKWVVRFSHTEPAPPYEEMHYIAEASADTAPLAICLAALKAVG